LLGRTGVGGRVDMIGVCVPRPANPPGRMRSLCFGVGDGRIWSPCLVIPWVGRRSFDATSPPDTWLRKSLAPSRGELPWGPSPYLASLALAMLMRAGLQTTVCPLRSVEAWHSTNCGLGTSAEDVNSQTATKKRRRDDFAQTIVETIMVGLNHGRHTEARASSSHRESCKSPTKPLSSGAGTEDVELWGGCAGEVWGSWVPAAPAGLLCFSLAFAGGPTLARTPRSCGSCRNLVPQPAARSPYQLVGP